MHDKYARRDEQEIEKCFAEKFRREAVLYAHDGQRRGGYLDDSGGKHFIGVVRPLFLFCEVKSYAHDEKNNKDAHDPV